MATLTAWKFDRPDGADEASQTLRDLAKQQLITIYDAATVTWPESAKKPKTRQLPASPVPVR
ncbi:putative membrane protein [Saccharopolyspora phatthalungensis]|uniref:Putative membrane protein n=1 Tax=Saccharopolyspora phatthalungensis TaxID=664693 RepID=A0A840Q9M7_9PSEU|nr:putative membrane protein [Saccharopolyspora phatthalungensis]